MRIISFLYHDINNNPSKFHKENNLYVTEEKFHKQLVMINNNFNIISPKNLYKHNYEKNNALITFDDSSKGIFDYAIPILNELKIPAIIFLNMDVVIEDYNFMTMLFLYYSNKNNYKKNNFRNINKKEVDKHFSHFNQNEIKEKLKQFSGKWASVSDLNKVQNSNLIYFGNHSYNHLSLKSLTNNKLELQIIKNFNYLSKFKNYLPFFSYPFGQNKLDYDDITNNLIKKNGHKFIFTANPLNYKINDNLILNRLPMFNNIDNYLKLIFHINFENFKSNIRSFIR